MPCERRSISGSALIAVFALPRPGMAQYPRIGTPAACPKHLQPLPRPRRASTSITPAIDELLKVPGMTRSWAGRIVRFRPYRTKQDLLDKGVVTSEVYDRIKDYVIAHRVPDSLTSMPRPAERGCTSPRLSSLLRIT